MSTPQEELADLHRAEDKLEEALHFARRAERSMGVPPSIEAALEETRKDIEALRNVIAGDEHGR